MHKLIELEHTTAGFNHTPAIEDANLTIHSDDFIGIIGPNGGGKTTLLKVILGLQKPWKGRVIYHSPGICRGEYGKMGYLPQINQFDAHFPISVFEVVRSGLVNRKKIFGGYHSGDTEKTLQVLKDIGIEELKNKNIGDLSGGQKQRVFLGRAIVSDPEILFLDEPNTYVDNKFERELYEMLRRLNERMAIVLVTHDIGTISSYIKSIVCVNKSVHHHESNTITEQQLFVYNCPIQLITHGEVPHTVLKRHNHE